ncbi:MAG TPA: hypothetical protein VJB82_03210 [Candidatus Peribacterales bacterium]|nr:hypothetical protein [Candidatus Peribacterales bacterium]
MKQNKASMTCDVCMIVKGTLTSIFTIVMIGALAGFFYAHTDGNGFVFGTTASSLSVLTLVLALMHWIKHADCSTDRSTIGQWCVLILLIIAFIFSIVDFAQVHLSPDGLSFGTLESSFSITAFAITAKHFAKQVRWMHGSHS